MNPFSQFFTSTDIFTIMPAVQLALFGCAILLFDAFEDFLFGGSRQRSRLVLLVLAAEALAGAALVRQQWHLGPDGLISGFGGSITVDGFAIFFNWIFLIAAAIVAVVSYKYLRFLLAPSGLWVQRLRGHRPRQSVQSVQHSQRHPRTPEHRLAR